MFERPASTVEKWYRITKVGEFLQQLVFSDELQGLLLMNCCVLCLHNRPVEQLYFFHSSSHITSSVPQVLPDNVRTSFSLCSSRFLSFSNRSKGTKTARVSLTPSLLLPSILLTPGAVFLCSLDRSLKERKRLLRRLDKFGLDEHTKYFQ